MSDKKQKWWGYRHVNGSLQAKRFFVELDIQEAEESEFCETVFQPFEAGNREEALAHIKNIIREQKDAVKVKEDAKKKVAELKGKTELLAAFKAGQSGTCEFDEWYNENH